VISETRPEPTQEPQTTKIYEEPLTQSVLQMIMAVSEDLGYPLADKTVIQEYSEEAVLNETMGDYRAHTGTDFKGAAGDAISAMSDGTVNGIYTDDYLGNVVSVQCDNYEIHYCGLDEVNVSKGDTVEQGDELGTLGEIPSEEALGSHLHIEIKVNGQYCDPLALITGEE
jgi:murein DD-endopeptidase MepM/ murein hydrolase activator NlpD